MIAFAIATLVGGANFIAVRFSNRELAPFWGAAVRFGIAALIFVVAALVLRLRWPRGRELALTVLYGLLSFGISYALLYWALTRVVSSAAAIVLAIVPLATVLLASAQGLERLRARGVVGAVLALGGIAWMTFGPQSVAVPLEVLAAMIVAALVIAQSLIITKRISGNHPAVTNAVGMTSGAVVLLAISAIVGEPWVLPQRTEARAAVLYVATLGSVGLFVLVLLVIRRWTASASAYMFVLYPVVTLVLGSLLAAEPVTAAAVLGTALVIAGVWFGALSPGARRAAALTPPLVPARD